MIKKKKLKYINLQTNNCPLGKREGLFNIWAKKCGVPIKNNHGNITSVAAYMKQIRTSEKIIKDIIEFQRSATNISCQECLKKMEDIALKESKL